MTRKTVHFLAGLPRSGSTVLAAILHQHPDVHATKTSGLGHLLEQVMRSFTGIEVFIAQSERLPAVLRGVVDGYCDQQTVKPIILDKSRNSPLPSVIDAMRLLQGSPKIVATVRNIPDCMASFVRLAKPENLDEFVTTSKFVGHLKSSYEILLVGYKYDRSCFLTVDYDDLVEDPERQIAAIHDFLGLRPFDYDFDNLETEAMKEDDEKLYGLSGLHDIKPRLARQHRETARNVLKDHYQKFCQPEFWKK
jgi:sulfotransferase